jgi:hypothetical protein
VTVLQVNPTPVGPAVTGGDIEDVVLDCLQVWLPAYLCEVEDQHGIPRGSTPTPRGWSLTARLLDKLTSDQMPCVVLMTAGVPNPPTKESGPGAYTATWAMEVGVAFVAAWGLDARRLAQLYACAFGLTLTQRPMTALGQPLHVDWRGESYEDDFDASRTFSVAVCSLNVSCREARWANGGPPPEATPPADPTVPFIPWVQVTETDATVTNTPPPDPIPT